MKNNESGMVLVTVTLVIITMSIFVISFLSQNLSQSTATQAQVDDVIAQEYAAGLAAKNYSDLAQGFAMDASSSQSMASTLTGQNSSKNFTATSVMSGTEITITTAH